MRLDWMRDNHPEYLMDLYREGNLQKTIMDDVNQANDHYVMLLKKGVSQEQVAEIRTSLLAPAEGLGMRKVPQLPNRVWETIVRRVTS